jgi:NADH dehydrogenase
MPLPRVVVVGGGFAGLAAARRLGRRHAVTLVDRAPAFEFLPNVHELVSRSRRPRFLRASLARLLAPDGQAFLQDEVVAIDPDRRRVRTRRGSELAYDALVLATGSAAATRGVPGVREHALPLRSVADGVAIGRRLRTLAAGRGSRTVTVVGGGFTGVECLGEILRRHRDVKGLHVRLIEPAPRLLDGQPKAVHRALRRLLADLGVELLTGESVDAVEPDGVRLGSGPRLASDLTIWTAGAAPQPFLAASGLAAPGRWVACLSTLQSAGREDVFLAGDTVELARPVGRQSYQASAMGRRAAGNVLRLLAGRAPKRFRPLPERRLVTFGYLSGFYLDGDVVLEGAALCALREALFQAGMFELDPPSQSVGARCRLIGRLADAARRGPADAFRGLFPLASVREGLPVPSFPRLLEPRNGQTPSSSERRAAPIQRLAFTGDGSR